LDSECDNIDFLVISEVTENSNKFQKKLRFWKEKSLEEVVTHLGQWHRPH
jgi:hypothetical protein